MDPFSGVKLKLLNEKASADYAVESKTELKDAGIGKVHTLVPNKTYKQTEYDLFDALPNLPQGHPLHMEIAHLKALRVRPNARGDRTIHLHFLEAFPNLAQLVVCNGVIGQTGQLTDSGLEALALVRCEGQLNLPSSALNTVALLDCDAIALGQGLGHVPNWHIAAGPNRPGLPTGLAALNGIECLTIQCEWFFSADISEVLEITSLKTLRLVGGGAQPLDLSQLKTLPNLQELEMIRHDYDPQTLASLGHLEAIYFGRGKKGDLPQSIKSIARKARPK